MVAAAAARGAAKAAAGKKAPAAASRTRKVGQASMATEFPSGKPKNRPPKEAGATVVTSDSEKKPPKDEEQPPQEEPQEEPQDGRQRSIGRPSMRGPGGMANDGAGVVLAFLAWSWVVLPYLQGGPERVRNVLRAKFVNKGPKGEFLP